jgi:hypothetical protein
MNFLPEQILLYMAIIGFITGVVTLLGGILVLVFRVSSRDLRSLTNQSAELAQKNLAEDLSGLIGNTSSLLESVNHLIRTTAGIGVFLSCVGIILMIASCILLFMIQG